MVASRVIDLDDDSLPPSVGAVFDRVRPHYSAVQVKWALDEFLINSRGIPTPWLIHCADKWIDIALAEQTPHRGAMEANGWLIGITAQYSHYNFLLASSDSELRELADRCAERVWRLFHEHTLSHAHKLKTLSRYIEQQGLSASDDVSTMDVDALVDTFSNPHWWVRRLRRHHARGVESLAYTLAFVNSQGQRYVSDVAVERYRQQQARQARCVASMEIVDPDSGEVLPLSDVKDGSVANPAVLRAEMMTRLSGTEAFAKEAKHVAAFVTLTCPGFMHRFRHSPCIENKLWDGTLPDAAHAHLNSIWARIRSAADRRHLTYYGIRVVEPHSDGTPHWHFLMFAPQSDINELIELMRHYALQTAPDEPGAQAHRLQVEWIDPVKGSATGYIAKYISKNIDGAHMEGEPDGPDAASNAERTKAWASTWGIRQFQFFKEPPVTIWRELRRATKSQVEDLPDALRVAHHAADTGDWCAFIKAMGGIGQKAAERFIKILRRVDENKRQVTERVIGVICKGHELITRTKRWMLQVGKNWRVESDQFERIKTPRCLGDSSGSLAVCAGVVTPRTLVQCTGGPPIE